MIRKFILASILLLLIITIQLSVLPSFGLSTYINLYLVFTLMLILYIGISKTIWWILAGAVIIDFYSILPFGITLISYMVTILFANLLAERWLTNRSYTTLGILMLIATVLFIIIKFVGINLVYWLNISNLNISLSSQLIMISFYQVIFNSLLAIFIFLTTRSSRFANPNIEQHI
ncbi:hypothetical protein ACFL04_03620 [Patescibacteria group bacterium]